MQPRLTSLKVEDLRTTNAGMTRCISLAKLAAKSDVPIVLLGETGTGKTLLAQAIHNSSARAEGPFISFNASAMSDTLLESQLFGHVLEELFENAIAILIDDIIAFENLRGHLDVAKNECAEALANHGAHGYSHGGELFRQAGVRHLPQCDGALRKVDREVANTFEVIGDFQRGDDQAHLVVGKRAAPQQAYGVFVDHDFHFIDARLEKKYFAGERGGARAIVGDQRVEGAIHGPFYGAGHGH